MAPVIPQDEHTALGDGLGELQHLAGNIRHKGDAVLNAKDRAGQRRPVHQDLPQHGVKVHGLALCGHHPLDDRLLQRVDDNDHVALLGRAGQVCHQHPVAVVVGGLHGAAVHCDDPRQEGEHHRHQHHRHDYGLRPIQHGAGKGAAAQGLFLLGACCLLHGVPLLS